MSQQNYLQLEKENTQIHQISVKTSEAGQKQMPSNILKRLIEEVKHENQNNISSYNRTHNRHNRGR